MPELRISTYFRGTLNGENYYHYVVYVKLEALKAWKFVQSFMTRHHAEKFIAQVKEQFTRGDYSALNLGV